MQKSLMTASFALQNAGQARLQAAMRTLANIRNTRTGATK